MAPPQVRDLQALIAEQKAALAPQQQVLDQSIQQNEQSGDAQVQGLDAKKTQAFGQIEQGAQNKGMFFSGFSPSEQASYTASTYLPALAQLQQTIATTRGGLLGKKADLDTGASQTAIQQRDQDLSVLRDWEAKTREQQFQATEAEKSRAFQAQQNERDRQAAASTAALNRPAATAKPDVGAIVNNIGKLLQAKVGKDGKVSPATFQQGRQQWIAAGGSPDAYAQAFYGYVNTAHAKDYF